MRRNHPVRWYGFTTGMTAMASSTAVGFGLCALGLVTNL